MFKLCQLWGKLFPRKFYPRHQIPPLLPVEVWEIGLYEEFSAMARVRILASTWGTLQISYAPVPFVCNDNNPLVVVILTNLENRKKSIHYYSQTEFEEKYRDVPIKSVDEYISWLESIKSLIKMQITVYRDLLELMKK